MLSFVISLGGSLIVPREIDVRFLKSFKLLIEKHLKLGKRFFIITGGGKIARNYQRAANDIVKLTRDDLDWLGIHATRLNAHLLRTIFRKVAYHRIIKNPNERFRTNKKIIIAAGYRPGCSTDYDAVLIAKTWNVKTVINLTNVDYVYDKNPKLFKDAKPLKTVSWKQLRSIIGNKWDPGLNTPFDPVAAKLGEKIGLKVVITNGNNLKNLDRLLSGRYFKGTIVS